MKQKKERAISPKEHLNRCLKNPLFSVIFKVLLEKDADIRPKEVAETMTDYSATMIGNYCRRLKEYGVFQRNRMGKAVYYGFTNQALKKQAERYFQDLKKAA